MQIQKFLIQLLKTEHNINAQGKDLDTVSLDAIRKSSDTSSGELDYSSDGEIELQPDEVLERETKRLLQDIRININKVHSKEAIKKPVQKLPVADRSDYVKRLLLANITYAKQNNINTAFCKWKLYQNNAQLIINLCKDF